MPSANPPTPEIDKQQLYGVFERGREWRESLWKKVLHKSLDIGEDDMGDVNAPKTTSISNGLGWRELAVLGLLGLGAWYVYQQQHETPAAEPVNTVEKHTTSEDVVLTFWQEQADGSYRKVDVPQLPAGVVKQ